MLVSNESVVILIILCMNLVTSKNIIHNSDVEDDQLIFASIIFRHGDRNPLVPYPNDPWKSESDWPGGFGELRNEGKRRLFDLGKYLRERYRSLLGNGSYSNKIVHIQSTDVDRTLMSAESLLAGLFPPNDDQVWNENLIWQPIPVHTIPISMDYVLNEGAICPRYNRSLNEYLGSSEHQNLFVKHKPLFDYLERKSGMKIRSLDDIQNLNNTIWIESITNKTLPEWTKKIFVPGGDLGILTAKSFQVYTNTPTLARLKAGFLFRDILEHFSQKIQTELNQSLWLYSGHDSTIANILNSIGLFELHSPPYAASLLFELYKSNGEFYFKMYYRQWSHENPTPINIPFCGVKCKIERFRRAYSLIIPTGSISDECKI